MPSPPDANAPPNFLTAVGTLNPVAARLADCLPMTAEKSSSVSMLALAASRIPCMPSENSAPPALMSWNALTVFSSSTANISTPNFASLAPASPTNWERVPKPPTSIPATGCKSDIAAPVACSPLPNPVAAAPATSMPAFNIPLVS